MASRGIETANSAGTAAAVMDSVLLAASTPAWSVAAVTSSGHAAFAAGGASPRFAATADSRFYLASVSKAFTAAAAAALVAAGRWSWEAPIAPLVIEYAGGLGPLGETLTFSDCLSMRVGYATKGAATFGFHASVPETERLTRARHAARAFPFRAGFSYHNANYVAARVAMERLERQPFAEILRTSVLEPLGLEGITYTPDASVPGLVHLDAEIVEVPMTVGPNSWGAGGLYASAREMGRWIAYLSSEEPGPLGAERAVLTTPWVPVPTDGTFDSFALAGARWTAYGHGFAIVSVGDILICHHGGSIAGHGCHVAFLPGVGGVAVLTSGLYRTANRAAFAGLSALAGRSLAAHGDGEARPRVGQRPVTSDDLGALRVGRYRSCEAGDLVLTIVGDGVEAAFADCPMHDGRLMRCSDGTVFIAVDPRIAAAEDDPVAEHVVRWSNTAPGTLEHAFLGRFHRIDDAAPQAEAGAAALPAASVRPMNAVG